MSVFGKTSFLKEDLKVKVNDKRVKFSIEGDEVIVSGVTLPVGVDNMVSLMSRGLLVDRHVVSVLRPVVKPRIVANRSVGCYKMQVFQLPLPEYAYLLFAFFHSLDKN